MFMRSKLRRLGLTLVAAISVTVLSTSGHAYSPEEQAACQDDAFRVCGAYIPDVDRVTACMVQNRSQLSPGCRVYFRDPEPPPAARARRLAKPKASAAKSSAAKSSAKSSAAKSQKAKNPE
jgi:hypothetical protein